MRSSGALLKPTYWLPSVLAIDLEALRKSGIRGLIFDLDDTLVHALEPTAGPAVCDWLAHARTDFKIQIVSNNRSERRVRLAAEHLGLPFANLALKPSRRQLRRAVAEMGLFAHEVAVIGDQLFTDVLGGNRLGAVTILVDPMSAERKWHRKLMRSAEAYLLRGMPSPPRVTASPSAAGEI